MQLSNGSPTPWGPAQSADHIGEGIVHVTTAGHGGYYVPNAKMCAIPRHAQRYAAQWSGSRNWYEEDCAWAAVALAFPHLFPARALPVAEEYAARYFSPPAPVVLEQYGEYSRYGEGRDVPDYGGAFDGFAVTSDADPGL